MPSPSIRRSAARPIAPSISTPSPAMSASSSMSSTGKNADTTCRSSSICSPPASIWARTITMPAASRRRALSERRRKGVHWLRGVGDGRQSGNSGSPSILNASPEAAAGGRLALLKNGDRVRIDLNKGTADILIPKEELEERRRKLFSNGGYQVPESQTPWQEIFRANVDQLSEGMVLKPAIKYQKIAKTKGIPRDNH